MASLLAGAQASAQPAAMAYDQTLASFLEAYRSAPNPKLLLQIAALLREMGRLADAANAYQHYLTAGDPQDAGQATDILRTLDSELAILAVHVTPRGSQLSIDGGPFVLVGSVLSSRVQPGFHAIRIRSGDATAETLINAFAGETKEVSTSLDVASPDSAATAPEHVDGWLLASAGPEIVAALPSTGVTVGDHPEVAPEPGAEPGAGPEPTIRSGVAALMRIDGNHWKGFAGGVGLAYAATDAVELELAGLRSELWGSYVGVRYRFLTGNLRPYAGAGVPAFYFTDDATMSHFVVGIRAEGGVELRVTTHFSVAADLGVEHFFDLGGATFNGQVFDETTFAPTVAVIGRM